MYSAPMGASVSGIWVFQGFGISVVGPGPLGVCVCVFFCSVGFRMLFHGLAWTSWAYIGERCVQGLGL